MNPSEYGESSAVNDLATEVLNCAAPVDILAAVYVSAADTVAEANATDATKSPVLGFCVLKPTPTTCVIQTAGIVAGFIGLVPNTIYYLATTDGAITDTAPAGPGNVVIQVGYAISTTKLHLTSAGGGGGGGGGNPNCSPLIDDLGTVGATFDPTVACATAVIKGVIDEPVTMTDITVTEGVADGMIFRVELTQGAIGGDVASWSANFVGGDLIPLLSVGLSVGVGKTDILVFEWDAGRVQWMLVGFINGIAP